MWESQESWRGWVWGRLQWELSHFLTALSRWQQNSIRVSLQCSLSKLKQKWSVLFFYCYLAETPTHHMPLASFSNPPTIHSHIAVSSFSSSSPLSSSSLSISFLPLFFPLSFCTFLLLALPLFFFFFPGSLAAALLLFIHHIWWRMRTRTLKGIHHSRLLIIKNSILGKGKCHPSIEKELQKWFCERGAGDLRYWNV